ncbi:MAG: cupredoxin domain-containing protein [Longimicrobiales bacterium]|nr:cupredoxin domain-containing protein [Longimicrobiales bacterium]
MATDMTALYATVLVAVGWVGAYFWLTDRREAREGRVGAGVQEANILVNGGYHPARVVLKRGSPIRLRFTRTEDGESWWDDVEFPYARVLRELAEGETVTVDVGPLEPGEYAFFSGKGRMRGTLVIEDGIEG